jgi:peptidoglycan/xylan/chitin deacetylase (PgdA/CDA1 family)
VFSLKNKTAKWCVVFCLIGGLVTSSSVVASQVKKPSMVDSVKLNRELPSPTSEIKFSYKRTTDILKSIETKSPRFHEASDILGLHDASNNENTEPANIPAENDNKAPAPDNFRTVYLTFDDGPHKVSDQILTMLDEYDAKATFFMLDGNMKNFPDAVKRMAKNGHSLGAHGVTHDKKKIYHSPQTVVAEMNQTLNTIKEITGVDSSLIRTPYGSAPHMTEPYKKAVAERGYLMWDWNIDSKDWFYRDKRLVDYTIAQIVEQSIKKEPLVILLHEREETLAQLPELLKYLKEQNYSFKPLDPVMVPIHLK